MYSAKSKGLASIVGAVAEIDILGRGIALLASMGRASTVVVGFVVFAGIALALTVSGGGGVVVVAAAAAASTGVVVAVVTNGILIEGTGLVPAGPEVAKSIVLAADVDWTPVGTSLAGNNQLDSTDSRIESGSAVGDLHSSSLTLPVADHQDLDC